RLASCSKWGSMTGSTCLITKPSNNTAMYWCESASGFTNPVNITVTSLVSVGCLFPMTQPPSACCKFEPNTLLWPGLRCIQGCRRELVENESEKNSLYEFPGCILLNTCFKNDYVGKARKQRKKMILVSPAQPVTEGQAVTLGCKMKNRTSDSTVIFYQNNKVIQNDTRVQLHIGAVSFSDEGFYKCEHSGKESPKSWMSVKRKCLYQQHPTHCY
ncbi:uncharacterized protein, partial [Nothobranchius furzeri]|uniref:uncharacterized protein n=1 Tax=Nothobranchius furzeri TaxID=105023 RepID=UPI003904C05D